VSEWTCLVPKCGFETESTETLIEHLLSHKPATALDDDLRVIETRLADITSRIQELRSHLA
jgi:hypothetical protein